MIRSVLMVLVSIFVILLQSPAHAAEDKPQARPESFQKLLDCKNIVDPAARLACFDRQVAILEKAESDSDVMIVDRQQVKKAKRGLFGFSIPKFGSLFGRDKDEPEEEEVKFIEATIKTAYQRGDGNWVFILEDGAKWVQTDAKYITAPKAGQKIRIRKAAMSSYLANINDNNKIAIRVRREN